MVASLLWIFSFNIVEQFFKTKNAKCAYEFVITV